jgi:hypothetical protein
VLALVGLLLVSLLLLLLLVVVVVVSTKVVANRAAATSASCRHIASAHQLDQYVTPKCWIKSLMASCHKTTLLGYGKLGRFRWSLMLHDYAQQQPMQARM